MSQINDIKNHLIDHGSITPMEALNLYGCFRLGARIYDLKRFPYGMNIITETHEHGKQYAIYKLV